MGFSLTAMAEKDTTVCLKIKDITWYVIIKHLNEIFLVISATILIVSLIILASVAFL